jgi:hypothetical protein
VVRDVAINASGGDTGIGYGGSGPTTLGPGIMIAGGDVGVVAAQGPVSLVGTMGDPTLIQGSRVCVKSVPSVSGNVTLSGCGTNAILDGTDVSGVSINGGGDGVDAALIANGVISDIQVVDFQGTGISCAGCSIVGNVQVTGTLLGPGVLVPSGSASITGLRSTGNHGDGLRCDGSSSLKLRDSILDGNARNGLLATDRCALDLGTGIDPGGNELNRTTAKNGLSGLCLLQTSAAAVSLSSSIFGCGYAGAGCVTSGTPVTLSSSTCQPADLTVGPGITLSDAAWQCCD